MKGEGNVFRRRRVRPQERQQAQPHIIQQPQVLLPFAPAPQHNLFIPEGGGYYDLNFQDLPYVENFEFGSEFFNGVPEVNSSSRSSLSSLSSLSSIHSAIRDIESESYNNNNNNQSSSSSSGRRRGSSEFFEEDRSSYHPSSSHSSAGHSGYGEGLKGVKSRTKGHHILVGNRRYY